MDDGLNVWLIHIGEPLPTDGPVRLFRYGLLARQLLRRGCRVTQWAGSLNHFVKRQRCYRDEFLAVDKDYDIRLMYGPRFRRNVGLGRLLYQRRVGESFQRQANAAETPDLIVASLPTLELADRAVQFGNDRGVPVVVDVRDLWPDIFTQVIPGPAKWLARPMLRSSYKTSQRALAGATALLSVSETYLQWGLCRGDRQRTHWDKVTPHGYDRPARSIESERVAGSYWDQFGLTDAKLRCCFFGSLGTSCDLSPFLEAMRTLDAAGERDLELVICGDGPKRDAYRRQSAGVNSVRWAEWIDQPKIAELMRRSHIGIAAYSASAPQSLPNKPIEYFAGGLGVISTLADSDLETLLDETGAGVTLRAPSPRVIASQLVNLRDNPAALRALKTAGFAAFTERFEADKVYGDLAEHLISFQQSNVMSRAA